MSHEESPFDAVAEKYDAWYDGPGRAAFATELAALRPLLPALPQPWFEIGVGSGRFAERLKIPLGIDPSKKLLAIARRRGIRTILGRGEKLPFAAGKFGTVFLLTTWEFLSRPAAVLAQARRVLYPGGRLVNAWLDRNGKWAARYIQKARSGHHLFRHARFGDYQTVRALTEAAGFEVENVISTLFEGPDEQPAARPPLFGWHPGASFVVIVARKIRRRKVPG